MSHLLEAIGYWFNPHAPSERPRPQALVGRWAPARRAAVVAYLRAGATFERYASGTFCRFGCGVGAAALGRRDLFDGAWVWPEGLAHYVLVHGVRLPERFVRHALRRGLAAPPPVRPRRREGLLDERPWLAWGRARGAIPRLTGWTVPDYVTRARLDAQVAARLGWRRPPTGPRGVVLVRADGGAVVVADDDGALAVIALAGRAPAPPPRRIAAGWAGWPVLRAAGGSTGTRPR